MQTQTLLMVMMAMVFFGAWFSTQTKRNKIYVHYTTRDKTTINKWVSQKNNYVFFEGKKFYIITRRVVTDWYNSGLNFLFPTKVSSLYFSWYSEYPHDPDDYKNVWETPETRALLNTNEWVNAYAQRLAAPTKTKQSMFVQYLPIITLVLIVLVGFYLYSNIQGLGQHIAVLESAIKAGK